MKTLSAGFILKDRKTGKFLACHVTGKRFTDGNWDIPKGHVEGNEHMLEAAYRELFEETGLKPSDIKIVGTIGFVEYTKTKNLFLYVAEGDIDTRKLVCTSYFTDPKTGKQKPEVDYFTLTDNMNYYNKSMQKIIANAKV